MQTGRILWQKTADFSLSRGGTLAVIAHRMLLLFGVYTTAITGRSLAASLPTGRSRPSTEDSRSVETVGLPVRPLIVGDSRRALDLRSARTERRDADSSVTGRPTVAVRPPGHHCGPGRSPSCLIFRSLCLGYYDLGRLGTMHLRPAAGLDQRRSAAGLLFARGERRLRSAFPACAA
jgi:hypothetical protein